MPALSRSLLACGLALTAAGPAFADIPVEQRVLSIERTDPSAWADGYARLLSSLRSQDGGRPDRTTDRIALQYADTLMRAGGADTAALAAVLDGITAADLRAAGYISLARRSGPGLLRPALDAIAANRLDEATATALAAAAGTLALDAGAIDLAERAMSQMAPGEMRASLASRVARRNGHDPAAFESWTREVASLAKAGSLRPAIELATAVDPRADKVKRDERLRDLALDAAEADDLDAARRAMLAILTPRLRAEAAQRIVARLTALGRAPEAVAFARDEAGARASAAALLELADRTEDKGAVADRLQDAFARAMRLTDRETRADLAAEILKRVAEKGWYAEAYAASRCVDDARGRDRIRLAAAKRAAELGDLGASEAMLRARDGEASDAWRRAKLALSKALIAAGEPERAEAIRSDAPGPGRAADGSRQSKARPRAKIVDAAIRLDLSACSSDTADVTGVATVSHGISPVDVAARRAALARFPDQRAGLCEAPAAEIHDLPAPIAGLRATAGYGSDQRAESFSWAVMSLAGGHLAGVETATASLVELLSRWAKADAFEATEATHDAYYALKRTLLPTVVAFTLTEPEFRGQDAAVVRKWLDGLVRRIDRRFDGDVDRNNHRYLADSVLMLWGSWIGDPELFNRGIASLEMARRDLDSDGSLPLERRRGARALWYTRQAASSFAIMIATLDAQGQHRLADDYRKNLLLPSIRFLVDGAHYPSVILLYSPENYIPGPGSDFFEQDMGFVERRGHGRHYMAWTELLLADRAKDPTIGRLAVFADRRFLRERPLIDEFAGGNASCFWAALQIKQGQG